MTTTQDPGGRAPGWVRDGVQSRRAGHSGHGWMMVACCIPMLVIAVALVATGVASAGRAGNREDTERLALPGASFRTPQN